MLLSSVFQASLSILQIILMQHLFWRPNRIGSGKTMSCCIGLLQRIDVDLVECQAIILVSQRESAISIARTITTLNHTLNLKVHTCVGGIAVREDIRALQSGVHVVVGTPGRITDMIRRGCLNTNVLRAIVLDEVDEILSRGFEEMISTMLSDLPNETQRILNSSTFPLEAIEVVRRFFRDPVRISILPNHLTVEGVKLYYVAVDQEDWKLEIVLDIFSTTHLHNCIIYCNNVADATSLAEQFQSRDYPVSVIHGEMNAVDQVAVRHSFIRTVDSHTHTANSPTLVLISTDLRHSGVIDSRSLVINYDLPINKDDFLFRAGRHSRFGRRGTNISLVLPRQVQNMRDLENHYSIRFDELPADIADIL